MFVCLFFLFISSSCSLHLSTSNIVFMDCFLCCSAFMTFCCISELHVRFMLLNTSYLITHLLACLHTTVTDYPRGWVYLRATQKYYRAIFELMDWKKADRRCRELGSYSRLVDINDYTENTAVKRFIASFDGNNSY